MKSTKQIFQKIKDKIIEQLEQGTIPWEKPFNVEDTPINGKTGNHYTGVNELLLQLFTGADDPYFMGYKQAQDLGGHIKKGESGLPIMFPIIKFWDKQTGEQITRKQAEGMDKKDYTRSVNYGYSYVWHISQTENIDLPKLPSLSETDGLDFEPIGQCEKLMKGWEGCPDIKRGGTAAHYHLKDDYIQIPKVQYFTSEHEVYATIFHEAIHATGASARLDREKPEKLADKKYSFEELIAELGSAYLCGYTGIEKQTIENESAYIQHWLTALKEHSEGDWIVKACSKARQAADFIISGGVEVKMLKKAS